MSTTLQWAIAYQRQGFRVFPMAAGTRVPLKDSHPAKDATTDEEQAAKWWGVHDYNIGVFLASRYVVILDIDKGHENGADGTATLRQAMADGRIGTIPDTYMENTPNGGVHMWFTYPVGTMVTSGQNLFAEIGDDGKEIPSGIDYTAVFVPAAPSGYNDGALMPMKGKTPAKIAPAPDWLLAEIHRGVRPSKTLELNAKRSPMQWRGELLNKVAEGVDSGNRNAWAASVTGAMLHDGVDIDNVLRLMDVINQHFVRPPLPTTELANTVNSICKAELRKQA